MCTFPNLFLHQEGHGKFHAEECGRDKLVTRLRYKQSSTLLSRCAAPSMILSEWQTIWASK
jgi:hypothetical protein